MNFANFLSDTEQKLLVEAELTEMANLQPGDTGLTYVIWMGEVGGQHGPRIKVSNVKGKFAKDNNFVLSVAKDPANLTPKYTKISNDEVEDVKDWIKLNYEILMDLWKAYESGSGNTIELLTKLKKLGT